MEAAVSAAPTTDHTAVSAHRHAPPPRTTVDVTLIHASTPVTSAAAAMNHPGIIDTLNAATPPMSKYVAFVQLRVVTSIESRAVMMATAFSPVLRRVRAGSRSGTSRAVW